MHNSLAIGIDPTAEGICIFEKICVNKKLKWMMTSPSSIAIVLLHTFIHELFNSQTY